MRRKTTGPARAKQDRETFKVSDYPFYFMHTIIARNNQNIGQAVRELGMTPHNWRLLALLQERDGLGITELADASLIDRTILSRILNNMEERRLVRRRPKEEDKRYIGVYLEPAGREAFERILPVARRQIERAMTGLTERERAELHRMLLLIIGNLSGR